jgi:hypothetical protein
VFVRSAVGLLALLGRDSRRRREPN